jgi:hypothetical protein
MDPTYDYPIDADQQWQKIVCNLCGAIVEGEEQHTTWHNELDKRIRLSGVGAQYPTAFFGGEVRG